MDHSFIRHLLLQCFVVSWLNANRCSYLYANELMVRCRETAMSVSREAREAIEASMLTLRLNQATCSRAIRSETRP